MIKRYTFWLWAAVVFQLLTAVIHSFSLFVSVEPANETERQIEALITTYRIDAGAGFHPTFENLFTALSSCFTFVCFLGGLISAYLLRKHADASIVKGITGINLLVFGAIFVVMAFLTFLPPIVCSGLIVICLIAAFVTNSAKSEAV